MDTVYGWLLQAVDKLAPENGTARLDAEVLLADALDKDRAWLLTNPEYKITAVTYQKLQKQLARRVAHVPLAYIRGHAEFYGREYIVNTHVLVPRPESETMINLFLALCKELPCYKEVPCKVVDVGTGSGALAITAAKEVEDGKLEVPDQKMEFIGLDIDKKCLGVARKNAQKHKVKLRLLQGHLLEPLQTKNYNLSTILANLPYVPATHTINNAALHEPAQAIFGGPDGLDLYRQLFSQLQTGEYGSPAVFTESLPFQHCELAAVAKQTGYKLVKTDDFIQLFEKV